MTVGPLNDEWSNFKNEGEEFTHPVDQWFTAREIDAVELAEICDICAVAVTQQCMVASQTEGMEAMMQAPTVIAAIMFHFGFEVAAKRYGKEL